MENIIESKWSLESYIVHNEALRVSDEKFHNERDRRYSEGNELRAVALKIKETADLRALDLERESQVYKDERNDVLRESTLKSTGNYATRDDLADVVKSMEKTLKPIVEYISGQQGLVKGTELTKSGMVTMIVVVSTIMGIIMMVGNYFI